MNGLECRGQPTFVPSARVRIPGWKREVERAMRELDPSCLTECVYDAEWAIFQRWQELGARIAHTEERIELAAAVDQLVSIMIHKLNWPDFRAQRLTIC
jgi:hypothetical protein